MKIKTFLLLFGMAHLVMAQNITLIKGGIMDSIQVRDSLSENFALYLPTDFDTIKKWPVVFVFDMEGRGKRVLQLFRPAAEKQQYILAASNNMNDSLSISQNILVANRMFHKVLSLIPIDKNRLYTAGFGEGGQLASVTPVLVKGIAGVISCGSPIGTLELLDDKSLFHFIGIVGKEDFNYPNMLTEENALNKMKFPNQFLTFDLGHQWPSSNYLERALKIFTLSVMANGSIEKDSTFVKASFKEDMLEINNLVATNKLLQADNLLEELQSVYSPLLSIDPLKDKRRILKKDKNFKVLKREENSFLYTEALTKEDYNYYLEEDVATHNFKNLGWWKYQMEEIKKHDKSASKAERQMGARLYGYVNALAEDYMTSLKEEGKKTKQVDEEGLSFLWMLKTITDPKDYSYYLKIISNSSKIEDYGTALFYLEELLKNGYKNKSKLYALPDTALLRITPEFNEIVAKYLKDARYGAIDE